MSKLKPWLSAMRLRTLPLSVSGIIIGTCLAAYNGRFDIFVFVLALLTTVSLQILSNLANDYGDGVRGTDNEDRVGPQRAIQSGEITPKQMFEAIKKNILVVIALTISLVYVAFGHQNFLYTLLIIVLGSLSIYAAINYTMGDSPYGYRALGDVFVFVFFGFISVLGTYLLNVKTIDHIVFLPATALGLLSVAVLNLNNMRDREEDAKVSKITLAVKLGAKRAKNYHYFLVIGAMLTALTYSILYYVEPYNFIFLLSFIPLVIHLKKIKQAKYPNDFDSQLKVLALTTFLFSILLGIGYLLY
ncbi:1,4-dihydroxy-2-naphthoate octaprenyltransferase [Winogradskyella sp. PC-19]|uniref:1,4-dihydroxy-2-naphthoate octaprenyltransferase n=1 Tax=unclassified Winogradskyella TaxID=2615021 RepID=UPI000B3C1D22|nr:MULTISPECIES: 1,4-dihydroxy-2-naphthoate octaprenyltransferase [unclassified Winogradskyella]ARV08771.1 1,4-dihydroxy-2-naphthoate octaprenyltransferase [Winogradskyella sp. PC-19]